MPHVLPLLPPASGAVAWGAGAGALAGAAAAGVTALSPLMPAAVLAAVLEVLEPGPVVVTEMPGVSGGSGRLNMSLTGTGALAGACDAVTAPEMQNPSRL